MKNHLPDVLISAGTIAVSFGAWQAWEPAGAIVAGVSMIVIGIMIART